MIEQAMVKSEARVSVLVGDRGVIIQDMDSLVRIANAVHKSELAPKGFESPEKIFVAIQMGMELGLSPMAALQNIAVINGRPTLWGDSQLAVCRSTMQLEEFEEWYEVNGKKSARSPQVYDDSTVAVCKVKRKGFASVEGTFSVGDAKRAGLWNKQGPWTQYPARMLRFRARSFALRDQFGDALKGLLSAEEVGDIDIETMKRATPAGLPTNPIAAISAPEVVTRKEAMSEELPMDFSSPSAGPAPAPFPAEAEAPEAQPPFSSVELEAQAKILTVLQAGGCTFEQFVAWAKTCGHLNGDLPVRSWADLPREFLTTWASRARVLKQVTNDIKGITA